jgi:catechol-2,3-dioxygenase
MDNSPIDAGVRIGHVHLKVADIDRALAFYCGVLGFQLTQRRYAGGLHFRRRLPSSYRPQYLGKPRR